MSARAAEWAKRACLSLAGTAVAVLLIELAVRVFYPTAIMAVEANAAAGTRVSLDEYFIPDEVLGIRPVFGTQAYDNSGLVVGRSHHSKAAGAHKVLFIGDSVTAYGQIVNGLANLIGTETTSFLNA